MLGFKTKGSGFGSWSDRFFFFFLYLSPFDNKAKKIKKNVLSSDYIYCECKNQEMRLCIKYLNRKGIEVHLTLMFLSLLLTFNLLKSTARSYFLVEELIFERSSRRYFFFGDLNMFIF